MPEHHRSVTTPTSGLLPDHTGSDIHWIAIVDEFGWMRTALRQGLAAAAPTALVTAHATAGSIRLREHARRTPDVLLIGVVRDSEPDVPALIARFVTAGTAVVLLADTTAEAAAAARRAGASSVLPRATRLSPIVAATLEPLGRGASAERPHTALLSALPVANEHRDLALLTMRERTALLLYLEGASINDVADRMGVGYETAKTFLRRVRAKASRAGHPTKNRAALAKAFRDGAFAAH